MIVYLYILESDFSKYICKKIILLYSYLLIADKSIFKKMVMTGPDISWNYYLKWILLCMF